MRTVHTLACEYPVGKPVDGYGSLWIIGESKQILACTRAAYYT